MSLAYSSYIEKGRRNPPCLSKLKELAQLLLLSQEETDYMIDIASEDRDEIPMDLPEYIKESELARTALRKARKKDEEEKRRAIFEYMIPSYVHNVAKKKLLKN